MLCLISCAFPNASRSPFLSVLSVSRRLFSPGITLIVSSLLYLSGSHGEDHPASHGHLLRPHLRRPCKHSFISLDVAPAADLNSSFYNLS